jgi:hypothetical protein
VRPADRTGDVLVVPIESAPQAARGCFLEAAAVAGSNGRFGWKVVPATVLLLGLILRGDIRPGG